VIGLPLSFAGLLYKYRATIQLYDPAAQKLSEAAVPYDAVVVARFGILFATYRSHRFYWEIWALTRRTLLLAFGNILQGLGTIRVQVLVVINLIILLFQVLARPFQENHEGNLLETFSLTGLVLLCVFTEDTDNTSIPLYEQVIVTMITLICMIILCVVVIRRLIHGIRGVVKRRRGQSSQASKSQGPTDEIPGPEEMEMQSLAYSVRPQTETNEEGRPHMISVSEMRSLSVATPTKGEEPRSASPSHHAQPHRTPSPSQGAPLASPSRNEGDGLKFNEVPTIMRTTSIPDPYGSEPGSEPISPVSVISPTTFDFIAPA